MAASVREEVVLVLADSADGLVQFDEPKIVIALAVEEHRLLVVQPGVRAVFDLDAGHVQAIDVPRVPEPRRVAVLLRLGDQPHRNAAVHRRDDRVGVPRGP